MTKIRKPVQVFPSFCWPKYLSTVESNEIKGIVHVFFEFLGPFKMSEVKSARVWWLFKSSKTGVGDFWHAKRHKSKARGELKSARRFHILASMKIILILGVPSVCWVGCRLLCSWSWWVHCVCWTGDRAGAVYIVCILQRERERERERECLSRGVCWNVWNLSTCYGLRYVRDAHSAIKVHFAGGVPFHGRGTEHMAA
jgi:hypothetical protein